jgi:CPA2 family monovalent cation:H+ antiporter-2
MKMLDEMGELRREPGRIAVAVLIAQDLAIVPMLILVSALGGGEVSAVGLSARMTVAVGLLAWLLWWLGRRGKLRIPFTEPLHDKVEILALGSLGVCFGAAALSGVTGLSPAYGAFIAGLVVGASTMRASVIPVIEPIQSVLVVVFFLSIGLLIDLDYIWANLWLVVISALVVIAAKTVLNVLLLRIAGFSRDTALVGGLSMAQIGEFSFVLAAAGSTAGILGAGTYRLAIAVAAITLLFSPAWTGLMHRVEDFAREGYSSYREALADAYASELVNVGVGLSWLGARASALRAAWHGWRARRRQKGPEKNEAAPVAEEEMHGR